MSHANEEIHSAAFEVLVEEIFFEKQILGISTTVKGSPPRMEKRKNGADCRPFWQFSIPEGTGSLRPGSGLSNAVPVSPDLTGAIKSQDLTSFSSPKDSPFPSFIPNIKGLPFFPA